MADKAKAVAGDDHVGLLILFILISILIVFATPVPFVVASAVGVVSWLFGVRFAAFTALGLGVGAACVAYMSGQITVFLTGSLRLFWADLSGPDWPRQIAEDWLAMIADPTAWKITSPIGLLFGGAFLLLREDRRNSPGAQVAVGGRRRGPTP